MKVPELLEDLRQHLWEHPAVGQQHDHRSRLVGPAIAPIPGGAPLVADEPGAPVTGVHLPFGTFEHLCLSRARREDREDPEVLIRPQRLIDRRPRTLVVSKKVGQSLILGDRFRKVRCRAHTVNVRVGCDTGGARRRAPDRDGWRCTARGRSGWLEVDHIEPLAAGGAEYDLENLGTLCRGW